MAAQRNTKTDDKEKFRQYVESAISDDSAGVNESDEIRLYRRWKKCYGAKSRVDFSVGEFVGFAEGTFKIDIPEWWRQHLRRCRFSNGSSGFDDPGILKRWTLHAGLPSLQTSGAESVVAEEGGISIRIKTKDIKVEVERLTSVFSSRDRIDKARLVNGAYAFAIGKNQKQLFVAKIPGGVRMPFPPATIMCVDVETGERVWKLFIDDGLQIAATSGVFQGVYVELTYTEKYLAAYWGSDLATGISLHDPRTGNRWLRFSTAILDRV